MTTRMFLFVVLCAACGKSLDAGGGGDDTSPDGGGSHGGGDGGTTPGYTDLVSGDWTLAAGSEGYHCVTKTLTQDVWITGFKNISPSGTHHTALSVGAPAGPDGSVVCGPGDNFSTIIYGAGIGTPELAMPSGLAVRVHAGEQLLLNLHVFNATDQALSGHSGVEVTTTTAGVTEAGIANTGKTTDLVVPPGSSTQIGNCTVPTTSTAFSVFAHMHRLGVHMKATATTASGAVSLIDMPYSFEAQRYYPASDVHLAAGDHIRVECSYTNDTGANVYFGQSSNQEMCGLGIYVTPPWSDPNCGF